LRQDRDPVDDPFKLGALLAEILGARWIVPDIRVFKLATDFLEALRLRIEVKDTP